jgi:hypothetical protein
MPAGGVEPVPAESPKPTPGPEIQPEAKPPSSDKPDIEPNPTPAATTARTVRTELVISSALPKNESQPAALPDSNSVAKVTRPRNADPPTTAPQSTSKPLFEPIIITIPKSDPAEKPTVEQKPDRRTLEINNNADGRGRVIEGKPVVVVEPAPCQIFVNQENISLVNDGGMLSVLVGVEKGNSLGDVRFVISDPQDISVELDPDVTGLAGRALYTVTSTSQRTGNYRVTFYLPCGKKDITVNVR